MEQTYATTETYATNYERGPVFNAPAPAVPLTPPKTFLGHTVVSRLGISAGLLLNSKWILEYARRGYDILTYKTVRSAFRPCYPMPNWVFVDSDGDGTYRIADRTPDDPAQITSSVCFGMPSMDPEVWRADVERAKSLLGNGQILIVSVVATPEEQWSVDDVAEDFAKCARWAFDAGADIIEANFSCPNVCSADGSLYLDPSASAIVAAAIKSSLGTTPLLIKTGFIADPALLRDYLRNLSGCADGVTMVNGLSRNVHHRDGRPVFGEKFAQAGILGREIHQSCLQSVRDAIAIIQSENLGLAVAAVGGVATTADIADYIDAGADAVLMGGAPMYLPGIAVEAKRAHPEW